MRAFLHLTFSAGLISALMILSPGCSRQGKESHEHGGLTLFNGWYVQNGKIIWGYAQHNGWWRKGQRPNLTRNAGDDIRPNRTENLALLADNMLCWGYPGFEHNFGLWYDRRRDAHDTVRRNDANVEGPFLEQPWARSGTGQAWDGLSKYDLTRFNPSYFNRLEEFAEICKAKGTILFHNFYMQHALLETNAHYVDFPWREANCIQNTSMPDTLPAANFFYDTSDSTRRTLHRTYIRRCLDALGEKTNVIHCLSEEYTGPASFMRFWLDEVTAWEREKGVQVHLALGAPKDVIDEILADSLYRARISTIDLRYWWYEADGSLYAPLGGKEIAGRYSCGFEASKTTPWQIYRQVRSYRDLYPEKAIIHNFEASRQQTWAFLTAGGSMLIRRMEYPEASDPPEYIAPEHAFIIKPTYDFINKFLAQNLPRMTPQDLVLDKPRSNWVLAEQDRNYLVYASQGGSFRLDLRGLKSPFEAWWFNPRTGDLLPVEKGSLAGGKISGFTAPDTADWALWLTRIKP